jgi:general secretion pathway protein D
VCIVLGSTLIQGCASDPTLTDSRSLMSEGRIEDSVQLLEKASRERPTDVELRTQFFRTRDTGAARLIQQAQAELAAGQYDAAEATYRRVQSFDPNNARTRDGLAELSAFRRSEAQLLDAKGALAASDKATAERLLRAILTQTPNHVEARKLLAKFKEEAPSPEYSAAVLRPGFQQPITLEFRDTPLRTVFEVLSRSAGINFVFDKDVRAENKITIFVRKSGLDEVMKLILVTNQLDRKVLNENSVLIYPNTAAKQKEYQELVTRSFYLANADVKQAQALVRSIVKTKDLFIDEKLNLLVMKDTPDAVRLADQLLASLDMAEPEVMLDVEVLEMTRTKLLELGLRFPDQIGYGLLSPTTTSSIVANGATTVTTNLGGTLTPGYVDINNAAGLTTFVSNPAFTLNLRNAVSDGNTLANPRIRVKNREKAKIHIGDKLPIFTTTSTANVGVASSVSYLDVGLKLDVEPNVYLDDEVSIKVGLEVSSVIKEVAGPSGSLAYQVGNRSASTVLRLRNGETQVLAGLISDEERSSANRLPGLGAIPVLGRIFSNQKDDTSKTEIVLLITPRIVRNLVRADTATVSRAAGSENSIGAPVMQLRKTDPRALSMSSNARGPAANAATASPEPAVVNTPEPQATPQSTVIPEPAAPASTVVPQ